MQSTDFTPFRNNLRRLIEFRNLTLKELGEEVGMSSASLSRYLTTTRIPDVTSVIKLADFFGVSTDWLIGFSTEMKTGMTDDEKEVYDLYALANEDDKMVVRAILKKYRSKE